MQKLLRTLKGQTRSSGFTLVELVVVVSIVGVLAAVATPKLLNVGSSARQTALEAVADQLGASSAANFTKRAAEGEEAGVIVDSCDDAEDALADDISSDLYQFTKPTGGTNDQATTFTAGSITSCYLYTVQAPILEATYSLYVTAPDT